MKEKGEDDCSEDKSKVKENGEEINIWEREREIDIMKENVIAGTKALTSIKKVSRRVIA